MIIIAHSNIREKIYYQVEPSKYSGYVSKYNIFLICMIICSTAPLMVKRETQPLMIIDYIATGIFILDYILRWITADMKFNKKGSAVFWHYPFTRMAVVDFLAVISGFFSLRAAARFLLVFRTMRVSRFVKIIRYSKSTSRIMRVLHRQKNSLLAVCLLALGYVMICALIIFNAEPQTFPTFFDALYWATVSLTTVGYGDIYPVSVAGRIITMISSVSGVAVIAMPAGLITAGFIQEMEEENLDQKK